MTVTYNICKDCEGAGYVPSKTAVQTVWCCCLPVQWGVPLVVCQACRGMRTVPDAAAKKEDAPVPTADPSPEPALSMRGLPQSRRERSA